MQTDIKTLGQLKASGYVSKTIKNELRDYQIKALKKWQEEKKSEDL